MPTRASLVSALVAGAVLAALMAIRLGAPWQYIHDDNGAWTQGVAAARLHAGWAATYGQDFFLSRQDGTLVPYLHHPPLYGACAAAWIALAGVDSPLGVRLLPYLWHLVGFAGFAMLAARVWARDLVAYRIALVTYAVVPMSTYFGKMPFNEPMGLALLTWAFLWLHRHRASGRRADLAASLACWVLAGLTSWTAYVLWFAAWIWTLSDLRDPDPGTIRHARRAALALAVLALATCGSTAGHLAWVAHRVRDSTTAEHATLGDAARHWGLLALDPHEAVRRVGKAVDFHRVYFANVPFVLYVVWLAARARDVVRRVRLTSDARLLVLGSAGCALWVISFLRQTTVHAYGQFWYLPFECLAVGGIGSGMWRPRPAGRERSRRARVALASVLVAGTIVSTATFLAHRYRGPSGYAVDGAARLRAAYVLERPGANPGADEPQRHQ